MAYQTGNLSLLRDTLEGGFKWWLYVTADSFATYTGSGYFSDASNKRMNVGDIVWVLSGTFNTSTSATVLGDADFPATTGVSGQFSAEPSFESFIVSAVNGSGAATIAPSKSSTITDNSQGVANATLGVDANLAKTVLTIPVQLADLVGAETLSIDAPFSGSILSAYFRSVKSGAPASGLISGVVEVGGTAVSGGAFVLSASTLNSGGAIVSGGAISGLNTFSAGQAIGVTISTGGTAFTGGDGYFELQVINQDLANAIATIIKY